jgi:transposase-like protein
LGSCQTAWAWLHKLRRAMVLPRRKLLSGAVEVDESYIGATRPGKHGRAAAGKAIVAIAVEDRDGRPGRTRMARIADLKAQTLTDFVLDHVARGSEVRTDAYGSYVGIGRHRFLHVVVNLTESGDPGHIAMPHVHRVASLLKRWLLGTTKERSRTASLTTTSTSSRSASTAAAHATAACCSTASSREPSPPTRTPTQPSSRHGPSHLSAWSSSSPTRRQDAPLRRSSLGSG